MFVSKTFVIEDCWRYDPTEYVGQTSANIVSKNWDLPEDYTISCEVYSTNFSNTACDIQLTYSEGRVILGAIMNPTKLQLGYYGQYINTDVSLINNQWNPASITVQDGIITLENLEYSLKSESFQNEVTIVTLRGNLKNIKIKPL